MSADNGVYILKTIAQSGRGFEYRISYASAIENVTDCDQTEADKYARSIFGDSIVMHTFTGAQLVAKGIHHDLVKTGVYVEYGVRLIESDRKFPLSRRQKRRRHRYFKKERQ